MPPCCLVCHKGIPFVRFQKCFHVSMCVDCFRQNQDEKLTCPFCHQKSIGEIIRKTKESFDKIDDLRDEVPPGLTYQTHFTMSYGYVPVITPKGQRYVAQGCNDPSIYQEDAEFKRHTLDPKSKQYRYVYSLYTKRNPFVKDKQMMYRGGPLTTEEKKSFCIAMILLAPRRKLSRVVIKDVVNHDIVLLGEIPLESSAFKPPPTKRRRIDFSASFF